METSRERTVALVALALVASLAVAYVTKVTCHGPDGSGPGWCYSDVSGLWDERGFDVDALPYDPPRVTEDGEVGAGQPHRYRVDYVFEYPPGIGFGAWALARATESREAFFDLHVATFALAAGVTLAVVVAIARRRGLDPRRALIVAGSPTVALLAFHNWDLWSVAPATIGLWFASRRRPVPAAAWLAAGAAIKWWPVLLLLPVLVGPWAEGVASRERRRAAAVFVALVAIAQVPAVLTGADRWLDSVVFHLTREPSRAAPVALVVRGLGNLAGPAWTPTITTVVTLVGAGAAVAGFVVVGRRLANGRLDPAAAALALLIVLQLTSKVVSVQFLLWLLPVAAVTRLPWPAILVVDLLNAAVWLAWAPVGDNPGALFTLTLVLASLRTAAMVWLLVLAWRSGTDDVRASSERRAAGSIAA